IQRPKIAPSAATTRTAGEPSRSTQKSAYATATLVSAQAASATGEASSEWGTGRYKVAYSKMALGSKVQVSPKHASSDSDWPLTGTSAPKRVRLKASHGSAITTEVAPNTSVSLKRRPSDFAGSTNAQPVCTRHAAATRNTASLRAQKARPRKPPT